jgi:spermidine synthase
MRVPLAAVGFTSIIAQIVLMRELVATFYGNELLFGLVLMAWLAWVAVGSWGLARIAAHRQLGSGTFATGLALAGGLLLAQMALVRDVRALLGVTPGAFVEFGPMVGAVVLIPAPLCLLTGFLFTLGARLTAEEGGTAGQAYVWESAGAVVGGTLFSFLLIHWLDPFQTTLLVGSVNLVVAAGLLTERYRAPVSPRNRGSRIPPHPHIYLLLGLLALLLLGAFPLGRFLHQSTLRWQWSDLVFAADSPYGRLTIQARDGQRVFFENGLLAFETQGTFPEEVAHFPLLAHPDPRSVLLIGGGVAGDLREILKHPVARVTYVELDPLLIEAAQAHLPPEDAAVLDNPRVRLILTDGRLYAKQSPELFDVIILDLPEPAAGALNRFYTRQFFAEVRAILYPGGVFALGLPSAENYWSPELARRNGSVYHTLRAVFPEVLALPGEYNFFLASHVPLEADPAVLAERLAGRGVETRWVTPEYIEYVFTTDRFAGVRRELEAMAGVRLNGDLTPICYYYDLALWLSRFYPNLRRAFESASLINLGWVALPLALGVVLVRWRRGWAVPVVIAGIGLAEMTLEVVILFAFQVLHGTIYAQVSLIITAFMAGLALGGAAGNRLLAHGFPLFAYNVLRIPFISRSTTHHAPHTTHHAPRTTHHEVRRAEARRALIAVQIAIIIYSGLFPLILLLPIPAPTLVFPLLALLAGALTGMAFPLAVALVRGGAGRVAGMLYGADLVGGCLGALLGAVLFIPLLGIPQTCAAVALVGLAGLLVLV